MPRSLPSRSTLVATSSDCFELLPPPRSVGICPTILKNHAVFQLLK
jgi:hypothetical protein